MNIVYGYGRGSTSDQVLTLEFQEELCKKSFDVMHMMNTDLVYGGFFVDAAVSSRINFLKRKQVVKIMSQATEGDMVLTTNLDRAFRSVVDMSESVHYMKERDISFKTIDTPLDTSTATGILMMQLLTAIAEFERSRMCERVSVSLVAKINKGLPKGGSPPIGWRKEGVGVNSRFTPHLQERDQLDMIAAMRENGYSLEGILLSLKKARIKPAKKNTRKNHEFTKERLRLACIARDQGYPIYGKKASEYHEFNL